MLKGATHVLIASCFAAIPLSTALAQHCSPDWTEAYKRMNGCGGSNQPAQTYIPPTGPSQEEIARQQRLAASRDYNDQGVAAYARSDWAEAVRLFQLSLDNDPADGVVPQNLSMAKAKLQEQNESKAASAHIKSLIEGYSATVTPMNSTSGLAFDQGSVAPRRGVKAGAPAPQSLDFGDPMVVDARNVPSGLPKSVDEAIPHTPAGEGVRKGFQAIQAGNWKAALAWFQAAVKKEPNNRSLEQLVDLAQFTLYYRPQTLGPASASAATQTDRSAGKKSDAAAIDRPAVVQGEAEGHVGALEYSAASSMAGRARAQAAWERYEKEHGDKTNFLDRARVVTAAGRGEGYSDEELKSQLHNALLQYRKAHKGQVRADRAGGGVTADEIVIGGKG